MKRLPLAIAAGVLALLVGAAIGVPALAGAGHRPDARPASTRVTQPRPPTAAELRTVGDFLRVRPRAASRLLQRARTWKSFASAHPRLAAELLRWRTLPRAERRAARHAFFAAHPGARKTLRQQRHSMRRLNVRRSHARR